MNKLATKILGVMISGIVILLLFSIFYMNLSFNHVTESNTESTSNMLLSDYDASIKNIVQSAMSIIDNYEVKVKNGELSKEEAEVILADIIREIRYDDGNYLWIDDSKGNNVVLLGKDTEGSNRMELEDVNGKLLVKEIIDVAIDGGGYTDYYFPKSGETEAERKRGYSEYSQYFDWVVGTGNYVDDIYDELNIVNAESNKVINKNKLTFITVLTAIGLVLLVVFFFIAKKIVTSIKAVNSGLGELSSGNLMFSVEKQGSDELGKMADAVNDTVQKLHGMIILLKDITIKITNNSDELNLSTNETSNTVDEITQAIQEVANGATEQASALQGIFEELQAVGDDVATITNESESIKVVATNINSMAMDNSTILNNLEKDFVKKEVSSKGLSDTLEEVKEEVSKIMQFVGVVNNIASQTNLLALNATIESARAGEAGKGFGVVATEIRKLAEQSTKASGEINSIVKGMTKKTEFAITSMMENIAIEQSEKKAIHKTVESFGNIVKELDVVNVSIDTINSMNIELTKKAMQSLEHIESISAITQQTSASTEEVSASTEEVNASMKHLSERANELSAISSELDKSISIFQTK